MKSTEFLQAAIDVQAERGVTYDKPTGERSMCATVTAFNAITGRDLSEAEGWLLLQTLKDVRQWQNPSKYHHDSALDGVAYSALKAEALSEEYQFDPMDMPIIDLKTDIDMPSWGNAPEWATHLMVANFDIQKDRKYQFAMKRTHGFYDEQDPGYGARFITEGQSNLWAVHSARPTSTAK